MKQNTVESLLEYYTNSIILAIKDLRKKDRIIYEKRIKEKGLLKNIRVKNLKQMMKKVILEIDMEVYFKLINRKSSY